MTMKTKTECKCPKCGNNQTVDTHSSLNVTIDPNLANELFEGKINVFNCDKCDYKEFLPVPLVYHDMDKNYVVWYHPVDNIVQADFLKEFKLNGDPISNITKRGVDHIVFDYGELVRYVYFREELFKHQSNIWNQKEKKKKSKNKKKDKQNKKK